MAATKQQIFTLHRYFIWANRMRCHFHQVLAEQGPPPESGMDNPEFRIWLSAPFAYASYWFATLFVIAEGWRELGLTNTEVQRFLAHKENLGLLRRFRNGIYHYQEHYFDSRIHDFLQDSSIIWATDLHNAMGGFFLEYFKSHGIDLEITEGDEEKFENEMPNTNSRKNAFSTPLIPPSSDDDIDD